MGWGVFLCVRRLGGFVFMRHIKEITAGQQPLPCLVAMISGKLPLLLQKSKVLNEGGGGGGGGALTWRPPGSSPSCRARCSLISSGRRPPPGAEESPSRLFLSPLPPLCCPHVHSASFLATLLPRGALWVIRVPEDSGNSSRPTEATR